MVQIESIGVSTRNEYKVISNEENDVTSLVTLKAGSFTGDAVPAPLFLVAVLDKSGSMVGEKMKMLKDTMRRLIAKLRNIDTLCIVTYDTNVSVILPPTLMHADNSSRATDLIDSLRTGSATNLSGGLLEGIQQIPSDLPGNTVISTLLLTDGHANNGIKNAEGIISMITHLWAKQDGPKKSPVYTFGYGSDHNSSMLQAIAKATDGMYYYIENGEKIADCFADVLGGLFSVIAQNLILTIEAQDDVVINNIGTDYSTVVVSEGKKYRVQLSDIQSDESRDIPVFIHASQVKTCDEFPLLEIELEYYDSISNAVTTITKKVSIPRVEATSLNEEMLQKDIEVDCHINRVQTTTKLNEAKKIGDGGDIVKAKKILKDQINKIQESVSAEKPLCQRLVRDLENAIESMKDANFYRSEGAHRIANYSASHSRQRAAPQGYDCEFEGYTYCNQERFSMQQMF